MNTEAQVTDDSTDRAWIDQFRVQLTEEFQTQTLRLEQLTTTRDTDDPNWEANEAHTQSALIASTRQQLSQITEALRRIDEGRYGLCERCAGPIPRERLEILPHARFCVPCQQKQTT
jgi:DnaK suppressor protein